MLLSDLVAQPSLQMVYDKANPCSTFPCVVSSIRFQGITLVGPRAWLLLLECSVGFIHMPAYVLDSAIVSCGEPTVLCFCFLYTQLAQSSWGNAHVHVPLRGRVRSHLGLVIVSPVPLETLRSSLITCGSLWPALKTLSCHGRLTIIDAETFVNSAYRVSMLSAMSQADGWLTVLASSVSYIWWNQCFGRDKNNQWAGIAALWV